jgi:two-component system, OmpR family, alkaline phosphatase synthesis response regulator PhoP
MTMLVKSHYRPFHGAWSPLGFRLHPPRVLVVDDEPHILRLVAFKLERAGFDVVTAVDGTLAIEAVYDREPDLCVLDVVMPGCSGWEVLQDIRSRDHSQEMKVIMLTALASDSDRARGYDLGADSYLTKPFSPRQLVDEVRSQLALT